MKGLNSLTLNQSTMREAVQFWIDSKYLGMHSTVSNVQSIKNDDTEFKISLTSNEQEEGDSG